MPSKSNVEMLEKVSASLEASQGVFVVDYKGLSVKETQEVRRALREAGAEMKVYKNNIVKLALDKAGLPSIDDKQEDSEEHHTDDQQAQGDPYCFSSAFHSTTPSSFVCASSQDSAMSSIR